MMSNNKSVSHFITFPGSGTHLLFDCLKTLDIPHLSVGDLIKKLLLAKKINFEEPLNELDIDNPALFEQLLKTLPEDLSDEKGLIEFLNIISGYIKSLDFENSVILQPHASYEQFFSTNRTSINWSKSDISDYHLLMKKSFEFSNITYKEIAYCRNPIDLVASKNSRFKNNDYLIDEEIKLLKSFVQYVTDKQLEIFTYEDLCKYPEKTIKHLLNAMKVKNVNAGFISEKIRFSTSGINKIKGLSKSERTLVIEKTKEICKKLNYSHNVSNSLFEEIKKYYDLIKWEVHVSNKFLLHGDFTNDGAISRHKMTRFCSLYRRLLKVLFKRTKLNSIKFSDIRNRTIIKEISK